MQFGRKYFLLPNSLSHPIFGQWVGIVICMSRVFYFCLNRCVMRASAGETLFIPDGAEFRVMEESSDLDVHFLLYQVEPNP